MLKRLLAFLVFLLPFTESFATHIVGGEFEMTHITGYQYRITLNLYFDAANGSPDAQDNSILTTIFEKGTNRRILDLTIPYVSESNVNYTNPACTRPELRTRRIVYSSLVSLSPAVYKSAQGYYIAWERCCRNNIIDNIVRPDLAGMTFYMEFPPVQVANAPFVNSSPKLFPPLSDYACVNTLFYYDFSGSDGDGDSLVYSLATPLQGYSAASPNALVRPIASPAPYPEVKWTTGLGVSNQVPGSPPMRINRQTGLLTVLPTSVGLYVFGVKCEEFRNGVKIGEVRRDFQLKTLSCPVNDKPAVTMKKPGGAMYSANEVLRFAPGEDRCVNLFFSDKEPNQLLTMAAIPVNFTPDFNLLPISQGTVNRGGSKDSLQATLCFPSCFDTGGQVFQMDILVRDNGCSLPKTDTVRVSFVIEPRPTHLPEVRTNAPNPVITINDLGRLAFTVTGTDIDSDFISLAAVARNFALGSQAITFPTVTGIGSASSEFVWDLNCSIFSQESYLIDFEVTSNQCGQMEKTVTTIEVRPTYLNSPPTLTTDPGERTLMLQRHQLQSGEQTFTVNVVGLDTDNHGLALSAQGVGFNLEDYGMVFRPATGTGNVQSAFTWVPDCRAEDRPEFEVEFKLAETACAPSATQTLKLTFVVPFPESREFLPANIFTPNGDAYNDYFELPDLPPNSCDSFFRTIQVFNRWGKEVYGSKDRNFRWDGGNLSEGVYFYIINFSDKEYKGTITLVR